MREYVLSTDAELDLDEIWEYIALDNIRAADRWVKKRLTLSTDWRETREWGTREKTLPRSRFSSGRWAHT